MLDRLLLLKGQEIIRIRKLENYRIFRSQEILTNLKLKIGFQKPELIKAFNIVSGLMLFPENYYKFSELA